ncbi:hypothetical protein ACH4E8_17640 [Streptomyces sp. NPDC017979]|uniref:hypothetical protein n=1 Tax=Streptomyces sp. NPDC017979 TaxID=3365024 RepID=UPI0037B2F0F4
MSGLVNRMLGDLVVDAKPGFACGEEDPDGIFQIRMNNITRSGRLDLAKKRYVPADHKSAGNTLLRSGDVLFNATNSPDLVGKTLLFPGLDEPTVFSNHFLRLRTDIEQLAPAYLAHWLREQFQRGVFKSMCRQWVNQATVGRESLLGISLPVPPLAVQYEIVSALDHVEALRAKRREALSLLDDLAQFIFLEMFGDPARNPNGWPMGKIADLISSASYGTSEKASETGDIPVLRMGNITASGQIDLGDLKFMDRASVPDKHLVRRGDILFNRTNSAELVGKSAIYRGSGELAYAGYLVRVRMNDANDPEYLAAFLNARYAKRVLRGMCKSIVGMANINARELQGISIAKPPLNLQIEFAKRIGSIESLRGVHWRHLAELDALFVSIQSRAFHGGLWQGSAMSVA